MNTSDNFRSGRFNFRSTTGNINLQFQNAGQDLPAAPEPEEEFSKAELEAQYQQGFQDCEAQKLAEIEALQAQVAQLKQDKAELAQGLIHSVEQQFDRLEQELCQETLDMAMTINQELIRYQDLPEAELKKLLLMALQEVQNVKEASIQVSTEDYPLFANDPKLAGLNIQENFQLAKNEVHIEHDHGLINTKLEERLNQIGEELQKALDHDLHQN